MSTAPASICHHRSGPAARMLALLPLLALVLAGCGGGGDFPIDTAAPLMPQATGSADSPTIARDPMARDPSLANDTGSAATVPSSDPALTEVPTMASEASESEHLNICRPPMDAAVDDGGVARFTVAVEGPRGLRYQWLRDDEAIPGAVESTLQWPVDADDHLARIRVRVSDSRRSVLSAAAVLRVLHADEAASAPQPARARATGP